MRKLLSLLVVALWMWGASSCEKSSDTPSKSAKPIVMKAEFSAKMSGNNQFAIDLFRSTAENSPQPNLLISPLSVNMALGMVWNGASGETRDEMQRVLGNEGYTTEQINEFSRSLCDQLQELDRSTELIVANSMWLANSLPVENSFMELNRKAYNARVESVDFSAPQTLGKVNDWCKKQTKGKIPKILDQFDPMTAFVVGNALYFKGKWEHKFSASQTTDASFTNADGSKSTVRMMHLKRNLMYNDDDENWRCVVLPYGNGAFSMVLVLPYEGKTLESVLHDLSADRWDQMFRGLNFYDVTLKLPRFRAEYSYEMHKTILPGIGLQRLFCPQEADLSGISQLKTYLSEFIHNTYVEVNEEGTEAAAASVGSGMCTSPGPGTLINFFVDQPFVYAIRENSTGTILFIGKMEKM